MDALLVDGRLDHVDDARRRRQRSRRDGSGSDDRRDAAGSRERNWKSFRHVRNRTFARWSPSCSQVAGRRHKTGHNRTPTPARPGRRAARRSSGEVRTSFALPGAFASRSRRGSRVSRRRRRSLRTASSSCRTWRATSSRCAPGTARCSGGGSSTRAHPARTGSRSMRHGLRQYRRARFRARHRRGRLLWSRRILRPVDSFVDVAPSSSAVSSTRRRRATAGHPAAIFALDERTGAVRWRFATIRGAWAHPEARGRRRDLADTVARRRHVYAGTANPLPWGGSPQLPNGGAFVCRAAHVRLHHRQLQHLEPDRVGLDAGLPCCGDATTARIGAHAAAGRYGHHRLARVGSRRIVGRRSDANHDLAQCGPAADGGTTAGTAPAAAPGTRAALPKLRSVSRFPIPPCPLCCSACPTKGQVEAGGAAVRISGPLPAAFDPSHRATCCLRGFVACSAGTLKENSMPPPYLPHDLRRARSGGAIQPCSRIRWLDLRHRPDAVHCRNGQRFTLSSKASKRRRIK